MRLTSLLTFVIGLEDEFGPLAVMRLKFLEILPHRLLFGPKVFEWVAGVTKFRGESDEERVN